MVRILSNWQQLSTKIVGALLGFLLVALTAIGATLFLSWQLEGSAAAINETGSLRMHNYRLTTMLARVVHEAANDTIVVDTVQELDAIDATFQVAGSSPVTHPIGSTGWSSPARRCPCRSAAPACR